MENKATNFFTRNKGILIFMLVMLTVPFILSSLRVLL